MNGPVSSLSRVILSSGSADRLRILTWHVHGNYLFSLSHLPHDIHVPVSDAPGHGRLGTRIPWGSNVHEVPAAMLRHCDFDCVIYQSRSNWDEAGNLLSDAQRRLPCVYLEHNPPEPHAAESRHFFRHDAGLLVHVTDYNALMWDSGATPWRVIEHGVAPITVERPAQTMARGIVVVNHLHRRGRRLGADLFDALRQETALDLIGMDSVNHSGLGEIPNMEVAAFISRYRYFFSPVRYGSLSLALIEAMLAGLPIVGLATTELPSIVTSGVHGYVDNRVSRLLDAMQELQVDAGLARRWGVAARAVAEERFGIRRFVDDWNAVLMELQELRHG